MIKHNTFSVTVFETKSGVIIGKVNEIAGVVCEGKTELELLANLKRATFAMLKYNSMKSKANYHSPFNYDSEPRTVEMELCG